MSKANNHLQMRVVNKSFLLHLKDVGRINLQINSIHFDRTIKYISRHNGNSKVLIYSIQELQEQQMK